MTDLYQITMAQGYFDHGMGDTQACFHMYFRNYPFKGGYAVACGMDQLAELVETYSFSDEDITYLSTLDAPGGGKLFHDTAHRDSAAQLRKLRNAHRLKGGACLSVCWRSCCRVRLASCARCCRRNLGKSSSCGRRLRFDLERSCWSYVQHTRFRNACAFLGHVVPR